MSIVAYRRPTRVSTNKPARIDTQRLCEIHGTAQRISPYGAVMAHDLRCALRAILSHRWFSAAVVATLALEIGLNTMVFTLINAVLFKPVPLPGGARLVSIMCRSLSEKD